MVTRPVAELVFIEDILPIFSAVGLSRQFRKARFLLWSIRTVKVVASLGESLAVWHRWWCSSLGLANARLSPSAGRKMSLVSSCGLTGRCDIGCFQPFSSW